MSMLKFLKNFCPLSIMFRLKYSRQFNNQTVMSLNANVSRIFFLDAPSYGNVGDQAIAYAIQKFARKYFPEYEFVEILQDNLPQYIDCLKESIGKQDIIFLTGGGNMGNIYRIYEAARRFVVKSFPDNQIVVFPQTIEYSDDFFGKLSCMASRKIYGAHKRLTLVARERFSYERMQRWYPQNQVLLCPDIVFSLNVKESTFEGKKIGICLRADRERALTERDREKIDTKLKKFDRTIEEVTTTADVPYITQENREEIVLSKLEEISRFSLFVTDRLHGMIFAILTQTPCIVFENTNAKIRGVYEWVDHFPLVKLVKNMEDFDDAVESVLNATGSSLDISFDNVVEVVGKG